VESKGFAPRFATDLQEFNGYAAFCTNICSEIRKSRLVIVDLSGEKLYRREGCKCSECDIEDCHISSDLLFSMNVYWEYGHASALNKRTILLCDETHYLPFNVAGKHYEGYSRETLESKLTSLLEIERNRVSPEVQESHEYIDSSEDLLTIRAKFRNDIVSAIQNTDLDIFIDVKPLNLRHELFNQTDYQALKEHIMRDLRIGPLIDSISHATLFGELIGTREGLKHIDNVPMGGSIIISRMGNVIYFWHDKKEHHDEWLQTTYISVYLLTFFTFLRGFFQRVDYTRRVSIQISIAKLEGWKYSPEPSFMPDRHPYRFENSSFTPITFEIDTEELANNSFIVSKVENILTEILLECGYERGFTLRSEFIQYLDE